jgi:hypothetical protein
VQGVADQLLGDQPLAVDLLALRFDDQLRQLFVEKVGMLCPFARAARCIRVLRITDLKERPRFFSV